MSAETILFAALQASAPITNVVDDRIYPVVVPDGVEGTAIAYQRSNTEYINTIENAAVGSKVTFDVFCVAAEFNDAESLCDLVEALPYEKVTRSQTWDVDSENFAAILTINVWPE